MKRTKVTFIFLITLSFFACEPERPPKDEGLTIVSSTEETETKEEAAPKTDEEIIADAVEDVFEKGTDIIKHLKTKDSIRSANREQVYAYQIGFPISDKDQLFETYKTLTATENIYVLKQSRKDFYLVYYNGYTEKQLKDSSEAFKSDLPENLRNTLKIINLMALCTNSKQKLMKDDPLTKRNEDIKIPCLICDK